MDNTLDNTCRRPISCIYFTPHKIINFNTDKVMHPYGQLGWLEHLCSEDTPCRLMIIHSIESYWIPSQKTKSKLQILKNSPKFHICEFWNKHYTQHTFWSCLIRCANMKWIRRVLLKIQRGQDSVHRRTDRQTDKVKPVYPPFNFVEAGGIIKAASTWCLEPINPAPLKTCPPHIYQGPMS